MLDKIFNVLASTAGRQSNQEKRAEVLAEFKRVPLGQKMLDWAEDNGVEIKFKGMPDIYGNCSLDGKRILIHAGNSMLQSLATLAHELRHAWQILETEHPFNPRINIANPFAGSIMMRFMEADASSFESLYMLQYLDSFAEPEQANELLETEPAMFVDLTLLQHEIADNPTDVKIRKRAFETYFQSGRKRFYDIGTTADIRVIDGWFDAKYEMLLVNRRQGSCMMTEQALIDLGNSAWGECAGENFLEGGGKPFEITNQYTGEFEKEALDHLREISTLPFYQGKNVIQMKNGQKRPLIQLGK